MCSSINNDEKDEDRKLGEHNLMYFKGTLFMIKQKQYQCSQTRISRGFSLIVDESGHRKSGNFINKDKLSRRLNES
jgi:hypothetical protein